MQKKREQKFTPEQYQARFDAGARAAQHEYCDIFALWRECRYKPCGRAKACRGRALACLRRGIARVPDEIQDAAQRAIVAATPPEADAPTRLGRNSSAFSLTAYGPE
jgi:hypothetical protein